MVGNKEITHLSRTLKKRRNQWSPVPASCSHVAGRLRHRIFLDQLESSQFQPVDSAYCAAFPLNGSRNSKRNIQRTIKNLSRYISSTIYEQYSRTNLWKYPGLRFHPRMEAKEATKHHPLPPPSPPCLLRQSGGARADDTTGGEAGGAGAG